MHEWAAAAARRWSSPYPGVYGTATGEPTREALLWAARLVVGLGAALRLETAAEVWGFGPGSARIHILVSEDRTPVGRPGIVVVRS